MAIGTNTGVRQSWRGRELIGAMNHAKAEALNQLGRDIEARMRADAHVGRGTATTPGGELRDSVYAIVQAGPTGRVDAGVGRIRQPTGRFASVAQSGPITLTAGALSDHGAFELIRGGDHDWLHPAVDALMPSLGNRIAAAVRGRGW